MRSDPVVLPEPNIDGDLRMFGCVESLGIQNFSSQRSDESFFVAVLPRAPGVDLHRLDADLLQAALQMGSDELWAVVRPDELRLAVRHEQRV